MAKWVSIVDSDYLDRLKSIRDNLLEKENLERQVREGKKSTISYESKMSGLIQESEQLDPTPAELDFVANELRDPSAEQNFVPAAELVETRAAVAGLQEQIAQLEEVVANSMSELNDQASKQFELTSAPDAISSRSWWKSLLIAFSGFGVAVLLVLGFVFLLVHFHDLETKAEITLDLAALVAAVLGGGGVGVAGVMYGVRQLIEVSSEPAPPE